MRRGLTLCRGASRSFQHLHVRRFASASKAKESSTLGLQSEVKQVFRVVGAEDMKPKTIVEELDKHIIGQKDAKKAVAVALRNRWRRSRLSKELRDEIHPKNLLMIGPTGVGKTELARRMARFVKAPFIKVEATKFTEVGFHGRDCEKIVSDLVDIALNDARKNHRENIKESLQEQVDEKLLDALTGKSADEASRESMRSMLKDGLLEDREVTLEIHERRLSSNNEMPAQMLTMINNMGKMFMSSGPQQLRSMKISEARPLLTDQIAEAEINQETLAATAISNVEESGVVFIDEIDKICVRQDGMHSSADASSEGVQRDLLPIIEGSVVKTNHGNCDTSKILFIASGAFHSCKPSDLLAELQGRLPIRVELQPLGENEMYRILTEPKCNLVDQQQALLATEDVKIEFTPEALQEMARIAAQVNETVQNIGARRLHTIMEKIVDEVSFDAPSGETFVVDKDLVIKKLGDMMLKTDLAQYVL